MKNIKKLLREQSQNILPDEQVKQNIRRELGLAPQPQNEAAYAHSNKTENISRKNLWIGIAAGFLVLALAAALLIPLFTGKRPANVPGNSLGKFPDIENAQDFYVYGAASVGSLLAAESAASSQTLGYRTLAFTQPSYAALSLSEEQTDIVNAVNEYLALVEGLLGEGKIEHSDAVAPDENSLYADFQLTMNIYYTDLLGERVSYTLFYDEILTESESDGDETEENYSIEGILLVEGRAYPVTGERESENEEDESENELQFTAFLNQEKTSFIRMKQKTELETEDGEQETEQEFEYTYYENNDWLKQTSVKYELEGEELELKMTVEERGKEKDELVFCREHADAALDVEGKIGGKDVRFRISIVNENGKYQYRYEFNGNSWNEDRWDEDRRYEDGRPSYGI